MSEVQTSMNTDMINGDTSTELAANRTAMSFERTAMSTHRTLHAVMKTSLSLIGFGFTIYNFFNALAGEHLASGVAEKSARHFGLAMIALGILILIFGIVDHYKSMTGLRERKARLHELGLVHNVMPIRIASSMAIALALLLLGVMAVANVAFGWI